MTTATKATAAKAWVALALLIVTSVLSSNIVPVSNTVHGVLAVIAVILGAISTWATPYAPKTIDGTVVK
jgi:hypothetical protein